MTMRKTHFRIYCIITLQHIIMSLVQLYGKQNGNSCGYCKDDKSPKCTWYTKIDPMEVIDYKNLIDFGWRRSGSLCYKPMNKETCCPAYAIRCKVTEFQISRSQKKVLQTVASFLNTGLKKTESTSFKDLNIPEVSNVVDAGSLHLCTPSGDEKAHLTTQSETKTDDLEPAPSGDCNQLKSTRLNEQIKARNTHPKSRPARLRRWIALQEKMKNRSQLGGDSFEELMQSYRQRREYRLAKNRPKQLEDYMKLALPRGEAKHFLDMRLCRSAPRGSDFNAKLTDEHNLYTKYQEAVHGDKPEDVLLPTFLRFLVQSPLTNTNKAISEATGDATEAPEFGSYHQQYWLDGERLIAVGVIDLLPGCLSSVYLFYDPEFAFLQLGTYSALREIAFIRELHSKYGPRGLSPDSRFTDFEYYYMGFYIHSCVKMRYKAQFSPSYLACSETGEWVAIDECKRRLDKEKYSRFGQKSICSSDQENLLCILPDSESIRRRLSQVNVFQRKDEGLVVPLRQASKVLQPHVMSVVKEWIVLVGPAALAGRLMINFNK